MKKSILGAMFAVAFVFASAVGLGAQSQVATLQPREARDLLSSGKGVVLLDVRSADEYRAEHIPGSIHIAYCDLTAETAARWIGPPSTVVIVYCSAGRRSPLAASILVSLGYAKVYVLGGMSTWPYGTEKAEQDSRAGFEQPAKLD